MPEFVYPLIAVGLAPFAVYFALKRPMIFPFGLYVMLVPFDAILLGDQGATLTRFVAIATAAALAFHMIAMRRVLAPPKSWAAWAALTLWIVMSALWTVDSNRTVLTLGQYVQLFVFYTVLTLYPVERRDVRILAAITVVSGTFAGIYGLFSYYQGGQVDDRLAISNGSGLYLDPNHFAASLLLPAALAIGTFIETRNFFLRVAAGVAAFMMVAGIFLTGSRGGLIAFAVMLLFIAWQTRYRLRILAFFAISGLFSLLSPTVWQRFADPTQGAGSGRLFIWNAARGALKDYWLSGSGFGTFPTVYNKVLFSIYQSSFQGWSRPAHNAVISAAVELGIFGVALLLYAWWRSWSDARGNVVIEAAIIALFIASLFLDTILFKYLWLAFSFAALVKNAENPRYLRGVRRTQAAPTNRAIRVNPLPSVRRQYTAARANSEAARRS
jgi:O-antigen ligase